MGNVCECVCRQTDEDEAEDALLSSFDGESSGPRGPPPPYQPQAPIYAYPQTEEQRLQLMQRLTLIQCLPCARYQGIRGSEKKGEKGEKEDWGEKRECPICMMDFVVGEPIRLLPCMHYYHLHCIDDWLMRSLACPSCMERVDISIRNTSRLHRRRRRSSSNGPSRRQRVSQTSSNPSSPGHDRIHLIGHHSRQLSLESVPPIPRRVVSSPSSPTILLPPPPPPPSSPPIICVSAGSSLRHRRNPSNSSSSSSTSH